MTIGRAPINSHETQSKVAKDNAIRRKSRICHSVPERCEALLRVWAWSMKRADAVPKAPAKEYIQKKGGIAPAL